MEEIVYQVHSQCEVIMKWLKWMNVDLPNLTSIIGNKECRFKYPRSVILKSISEYWILVIFRYSKSSKCETPLWSGWSSIGEC